MNPSNPTATEMQQIESLFFEQMKRQTRLVTDPVLMARMRNIDFQFSDRWIVS